MKKFSKHKKFLLAILAVFLGFLVLPNYSFGDTCQLVNVVTDKTQIRPGETIQINVTAESSCIGQDAVLSICNSLGCGDLTTQKFTSRKVGSQDAINPIVHKWTIPSNYSTQDIRIYFSAKGPANTVRSKDILVITGKQGELTGFSLTQREFNLKIGEKIIAPSGNFNSYLTGGTSPYSWKVISGKLPDGTKLSRDGIISGTPKKEGKFIFGVRIEDKAGNKIEETITINVLKEIPGGPDLGGPGGEPGGPGGEPGGQFPGVNLTIQVLEQVINNLVCWIYRVAFALIVIFIVLTGIRYLASGGNPTKITAVHQSFKWVIIGSAVILGVGVIIATITAALGLPFIAPVIC